MIEMLMTVWVQVSPLHVAAFYDSEWDVLLMAGADTQLKEAGGRRVIDIAHTMAPRMGYLEDQSAAPEWLSPHTDHRKLLMLLEKMEAGFEIDAQVAQFVPVSGFQPPRLKPEI